MIDLFLFTANPDSAREAYEAGIDAFVLDWEKRGKSARQRGFDTEINADGPDDVRAVADAVDAPCVCRINAFGSSTPLEVEQAIGAGASHLLLPMVTTPNEVEAFLRIVDGRVAAGVLIETVEACGCAAEIARLPLSLVYMGLNDLSISRGTPDLFAPLVDGVAIETRAHFETVPFGIGGLTVVDGGSPIRCLDLMGELTRLRVAFTFLRRSFRRDTEGRELKIEVDRIRREWSRLTERAPDAVEEDHRRFAERYLPGILRR